MAHSTNFILLQWLVVDGFQQCNLKLLFQQIRLPSPDSPPLQAIQFRYAQGGTNTYNIEPIT